MVSKAQKAAAARYDRTHTRQFTLKLNLETDADILRKFAECGNIQGYIKRLVRADLKKD